MRRRPPLDATLRSRSASSPQTAPSRKNTKRQWSMSIWKPCKKSASRVGDDDLRLTLRGRGREHQPQADEGGDADEQKEQKAAEPAIIGEGADIGIMRLEIEDEAEAQGPKAHEAVEQHGNGAQLIAEAARRAVVVILRGGGALIEKVRASPGLSEAAAIRATIIATRRGARHDDAPLHLQIA